MKFGGYLLLFYLLCYIFCILGSGSLLIGGDELRMVGLEVWKNIGMTVHYIIRKKWRKRQHWILTYQVHLLLGSLGKGEALSRCACSDVPTCLSVLHTFGYHSSLIHP